MGVEFRVMIVPRRRPFRPTAEATAELVEALLKQQWLPTSSSSNYPTPSAAKTIDEETLAIEACAVCHQDGREGEVPFPVTATWLEGVLQYDTSLTWIVEDTQQSGVRYPFTNRPPEAPHWSITLDFPVDYLYDPNLTKYDRFLPREGFFASVVRRVSGRPAPEYVVTCSCGTRIDYKQPRYSYSSPYRIREECPNCKAQIDPSEWPATCENNIGYGLRLPGGATSRFAVFLDCEKALPEPENDIEIDPELLALLERILGVPMVTVPEYY